MSAGPQPSTKATPPCIRILGALALILIGPCPCGHSVFRSPSATHLVTVGDLVGNSPLPIGYPFGI